MDGVLHDLRIALRSLGRSPAFFIIAVATLATAIAVNAAMFSFLNAVFFRPPPFPEPSQLHTVYIAPPATGAFRPLPVREMAQHLEPYGELAPHVERSFVVSGGVPGTTAIPETVSGAVVDERFMRVLGMQPVLGRAFDARDAEPGAPATVVITDRFWRARFDGAADVVGRTVRIDGIERTVIGVVADRAAFPDFAEFWVGAPLSSERADAVQLLIRVQPGVTPQAASDAAMGALLAAGAPARVSMSSIRPRADALLTALLGAIGFVLLIACSNVANLVLARGTARRHELGVRSALGASRAALLRYLSLEGAILVCLAAGVGTLSSRWLLDLIIAEIPTDGLPVGIVPDLDWRVITYIVVLAGCAVLLSCVLPAITLTRGALATALRESGSRTVGDAAASRMRMALVVTQIALATVLLGGAGLLVRGMTALGSVDPGFPADEVLELRTMRPPAPSANDDFAKRATARLNAVAGVERSAASADAYVLGRVIPADNPDRAARPFVEAVSTTYFETLGLRILRGQSFREGEADANTAVLSEQVARTLFGTLDDALGATLSFESNPARTFMVVGVVNDRVRSSGSGGTGIFPRVYVPLAHGDARSTRLLARVAAGDPLRLAAAATEVLLALERDVVVQPARILGDVELDESGNLRWFASVFGAFGAIAIALAALGISGVVAYGVNRRVREIGVRITLGATSGRIVREVMSGVLPATAIGLGVGLLGALSVGQLLRSVLHGFSPIDPVTIASVLAGFAAVTALAAWLPARRAARIEPMRVLRE
jgi:predicted permease